MRRNPSDEVIDVYRRHGKQWAALRTQALFERAWLDRFLALCPGRRILDLGCGSGRPIAAYLAAQGCRVTGVDTAPDLLAMFSEAMPSHSAVLADMRTLALGETFDGIIAWDSFFHLSPDDQRAMFATFADHAAPGAALMFTSGAAEGESCGQLAGTLLYHASLETTEYRRLLTWHGFVLDVLVQDDPDCGGHTVWLARRKED